MKPLQMSDDLALKLYPTVAPELKFIMEESFGKEFFSMKITDRIGKSFQKAYRLLPKSDKLIVAYDKLVDNEFPKADISRKAVEILIKVLNEGWLPNWKDASERKWYPWFKFEGSGFVFTTSVCDTWATVTAGGSRFVLRNEELSDYLGKNFPDLYNDFLLFEDENH